MESQLAQVAPFHLAKFEDHIIDAFMRMWHKNKKDHKWCLYAHVEQKDHKWCLNAHVAQKHLILHKYAHGKKII